MNWIYLSPHFDDVALSCGGLLWEQSHVGDDISIWTIFAGKPSQTIHSPIINALHTRWQSGDQAIAIRKKEDKKSCRYLNASYHHFSIPDCIYRADENCNPLYPTEQSLFGAVNKLDTSIVEKMAKKLLRLIPSEAKVVCPLSIGNHIDHRLTRQIAAKIGKPVWFYADFPYIIKNPGGISNYLESDWVAQIFPISENGFQAWLKSVSAHRSQISTFWRDLHEMELQYRAYLQNHQGIPLWHPCQKS